MAKVINVSDQWRTKRKSSLDSFHIAIGPALFVAQCFGIMPVLGILNKNVRKVHFKWLSYRMLPTMFILIMGFIETVLIVIDSMKHGIDLGRAGAVTFYTIVFISNLLFLNIAKEWSHIIRVWSQSEIVFLNYPYRSHGSLLKWKIRLVAFTFIIFAFFEHIMYLTSCIFNSQKFIKDCNLTINIWEHLFRNERAHLINRISYSHFYIIPLEYVNISNTFCWTFVDLFIIMISIGLSTRFNQLNNRLSGARGKIMPESFWIEMRAHYLILTELLYFIDNKLTTLILLSCSNNLYFVCVQLFNSFSEIPYLINNLYFWISLLFVICRTLSMLFFAASIHDATKKPLNTLRNVPSSAYSIEVQRFTYQITNDLIALSGKRFFYLTRRLILAMIGTVATYELVLLDEIKTETQVKHCPDGTIITK